MKLTGTPAFYALLNAFDMHAPKTEYRFSPPRRWRFDYVWIVPRVALEVEGGIWIRGRHSRGAGMLKDMEKYNHAVIQGWRVLRCTPDTLCTRETMRLLWEAGVR